MIELQLVANHRRRRRVEKEPTAGGRTLTPTQGGGVNLDDEEKEKAPENEPTPKKLRGKGPLQTVTTILVVSALENLLGHLEPRSCEWRLILYQPEQRGVGEVDQVVDLMPFRQVHKEARRRLQDTLPRLTELIETEGLLEGLVASMTVVLGKVKSSWVGLHKSIHGAMPFVNGQYQRLLTMDAWGQYLKTKYNRVQEAGCEPVDAPAGGLAEGARDPQA